MALSLNDIKSKLAEKDKTQKIEEPIIAESSQVKRNSFDLEIEIQNAIKEMNPPMKNDNKRPWESFEVDKIASNMRAQKAILKAREIKLKNEMLVNELRKRAELLEKNPEEFFNQ